MARIRTIKPEFWTSEQVMNLSPNARLLFIGLWNFCDDAGIHPASLKRLKAEVMPADDVRSEDVRRMIDECIGEGLIREYEIDGDAYWAVTGWHHQKIDQPSYKYPSEDGTVPEGPAKRRQASRKSKGERQVFAERSPPEGKGREGKGKEDPPNPPGGEGDAEGDSGALPGAAVRKTKTAFDPMVIDLPAWLPRGTWAAWCEARRQMRKPLTEAGASRQIADLAKWRSQGYDPTEIINTSINAGWQGLFVPKGPPPKPPASAPVGRDEVVV
jgi:hypothetical protein